MVGGLLDRLVSRLEAVLAQKRFTQLGGLALERDLRLLLGERRAGQAHRSAAARSWDSYGPTEAAKSRG